MREGVKFMIFRVFSIIFFIIFIVISVSLDLFPCVTNKSFFFFFLVPVLALFYLSATP